MTRSRSSPASPRTRQLWASAGLLLLCTLAGGCSKRRPDVIVIVVDTLRADRLSAYGYGKPTSPYIDRLAAEGTLFTDVTAQFSWTMPSMVSLMTGRYLTEFQPAIPDGIPSMAETFRDAGYGTVASVANLLVEEKAGFARGFERYDVRPSRAYEARQAANGATPPPGQPPMEEGHAVQPTRDFAELARDFLEQVDLAIAGAKGGKRPPMFLYLHVFDPHDPYVHHPRFDGELTLARPAPGADVAWWNRGLAEAGRTPPDGRADWSAEFADIERGRARYDQEIRYTDEQLELLMEQLRKRGLLENAVVALVSDHGEGLWDHQPPLTPEQLAELPLGEFYYQGHGATQFQEAIATPMILWGRGVPADTRFHQAVENVDLFPTLLELADVAAQGPLHGRSLMPSLGDEPSAPFQVHKFVFSYSVHGNSVRETDSGLKLILPRGRSAHAGWKPRLYDLRADPRERHDLAAERPDDVARLTKACEDWIAAHPTTAYRRDTQKVDHDAMRQLGYTGDDTGIDESK